MFKLLALAGAALMALIPAGADASVSLALAAGPGVDLSNIHVGNVFELDLLQEGSAGDEQAHSG